MTKIRPASEVPADARPLTDDTPVPVAQTTGLASVMPGQRELNRESIEFELPDGMVIEMAPPQTGGKLPSERMGEILKDCPTTNAMLIAEEKMQVRALMFVRRVNGETILPLYNATDRMNLEQKLGLDGVDAVSSMWLQHFPPLGQRDIKLRKKS